MCINISNNKFPGLKFFKLNLKFSFIESVLALLFIFIDLLLYPALYNEEKL